MLALHVGAVLSHVTAAAAWVVQEGGGAMATDPLGLWKAMGWVARTVVVILFIMSGWSIGVMIDRWMAYSAARKQSRAFAPAVAGASSCLALDLRNVSPSGSSFRPSCEGFCFPLISAYL